MPWCMLKSNSNEPGADRGDNINLTIWPASHGRCSAFTRSLDTVLRDTISICMLHLRTPSLHTLLTSSLVVLLSVLLYRQHKRSAASPASGGIYIDHELSDTSYSTTPSIAPATHNMTNARLKVLLVNDDGPPSTSSPHVLGLYEELCALGWEVSVVLPSFQKSWGSMQFSLQGPVAYWYYYPIKGNFDGKHRGTPQSWSATRRPINRERGEIAEWILIDGSPTTASNAGLFNQNAFFGDTPEERDKAASTKTQFDLVVSGPNFGRNTGTAFALSSGTVGAAMAASLAGVRSIAVSFGHFTTNPPTFAHRSKSRAPGLDAAQLRQIAATANKLSASLIQRLYDNWAHEPDVGCYSINIPLCETISQPQVIWTRIWENRYGPLFAAESTATYPAPLAPQPPTAPKPQNVLHFAPNMASLLGPTTLPEGTDVWAILNGYVSITRLRPNFMEVDRQGRGLDVPKLSDDKQERRGDAKEAEVKPPAALGFQDGLQDGLDVGKRWRL